VFLFIVIYRYTEVMPLATLGRGGRKNLVKAKRKEKKGRNAGIKQE
jgi:hypothetical protein